MKTAYNKFFIFIFSFLSFNGYAQYAEPIHFQSYPIFFAKDYALKKIHLEDVKILFQNRVKSVVTTDSREINSFDTLKFSPEGFINYHSILNSHLRNELDGPYSFMFYSDEFYKLSKESEGTEQFEYYSDDLDGNVSLRRKLIVSHDSIIYVANLYDGVMGSSFIIEPALNNRSAIGKLIESTTFDSHSILDNSKRVRMHYKYAPDKSLSGLNYLNDAGYIMETVSVFYPKDTIIFKSSKYTQDTLNYLPDLGKEIYLLEGSRIKSKEIFYSQAILKNEEYPMEHRPVSIKTDYFYSANGLIDYTYTQYEEYTNDRLTHKNEKRTGEFKKYYHYRFYE